jgi:CRISPR-associated Csx3 family protein
MLKKVLVEVKIIKDGGILSPADLPALNGKVETILSQKGWDCLVILSGRLPVWAYASLCHSCHPAKGVATYEPRSNAGIVVSRHAEEVPSIGTCVPVEDAEKVEVIF